MRGRPCHKVFERRGQVQLDRFGRAGFAHFQRTRLDRQRPQAVMGTAGLIEVLQVAPVEHQAIYHELLLQQRHEQETLMRASLQAAQTGGRGLRGGHYGGRSAAGLRPGSGVGLAGAGNDYGQTRPELFHRVRLAEIH